MCNLYSLRPSRKSLLAKFDLSDNRVVTLPVRFKFAQRTTSELKSPHRNDKVGANVACLIAQRLIGNDERAAGPQSL